ncbi:ubiquitin-like autophagy protein Apg12 [Apiospora aurea]|uniref:Ubiquitin-like protein ATG12 n=1 Tax=Apiospora aurea TaxID=335848 RepID=A0ABR1QV46_9PEZI
MEYPDVPEHTNSPSPPPSPILDRPASPELPLTMTASAVLTALPRDASSALASAGDQLEQPEKVVVRFKAVGAAPQLSREVRKITASQKFEAVVAHLRKALRVAPTEGLFLYVNSAFAPALDEVVGNLHRCFKDSSDQLVVAYSMTPAFG